MRCPFVVNSLMAWVKYRQLIGNGAESFANGSSLLALWNARNRGKPWRSVLGDNNEFILFSFSSSSSSFRGGRGRSSFTKVLELVPGARYAVRYARHLDRFIGAVTSLRQRLQGIIFNKPGYSARRCLILIARSILVQRRWITDDRG